MTTATSLVAPAFVVLFLLTTAYYLARLINSAWPARSRTSCRGDVSCDVSHLVMALAMAAMFSSLSDSVPAEYGVVAFGLLGGWFAAMLVRDGVATRSAAGGDGHGSYAFHHLVGCLAMIYMYAAAGHSGGTHAAHAGAHHAMPSPMIVGWLLGLYFVVAAASLGFRVEATDSPRLAVADPLPLRRWLSSAAWSRGCDVLMSAGMAVMLFTSL